MNQRNLKNLLLKVIKITIIVWIQNTICTKQEKLETKELFKPTVVLIVDEGNLTSDCTIRPSILINGTSPGPELRFKQKPNQIIWIRVINNLKNQGISLHFHGLSQLGSPFSDGAMGVSQFGIPPNGGHFDYEFRLKHDSVGTYIYHLHTAFAILTAYGPFIIEESTKQKRPYKYDSERTLMFGDYYHATDQEIMKGLKSKPIKFLGEPQSLIVNGQASKNCDISNSRFGCVDSCNTHVIKVKPGKTYRIRVIGITSLTYLYFGIESHQNITIIEVDGGYIKPIETTHIQLGSGQRYSFLLKTKTKEELKGKTEYYGRIESRWRKTKDIGFFILKYESEEEDENQKKVMMLNNRKKHDDDDDEDDKKNNSKFLENLVYLPDEDQIWITNLFRPIHQHRKAPNSNEVNRRIFIIGQQKKAEDGSVNWFVNNKPYVENRPKIPYLVEAYTKGIKPNYEESLKNNGYDSNLNAYPIKLGEVIEFVIINLASTSNASEAHPWHWHGHKLYIIAEGFGKFDENQFEKIEKQHKGKFIERDTQIILTGNSKQQQQSNNNNKGEETKKIFKDFDKFNKSGDQVGWIVVRIRANNPGAFLVHCHLQVHAFMGMAFVLLIGMENLPPLPKHFLNFYTNPNSSIISNQSLSLKPISYFDSIPSDKNCKTKKLKNDN